MSNLPGTNLNKFSRREFLRITAVAGTLLAGGGLLGWGLNSGLATLRQTRTLMGTVINLAVVTEDESFGQAAIETTFAEMERLIGYFDHRRPTSPVSRLNQTGHLPDAPPELVQLIKQAIHYGDLTGGAFDISVKPLVDLYQTSARDVQGALSLVDYRQIRVERNTIVFDRPGMSVTLDSIAKGRVVDAATAVLKSNGFGNVLVEAGGDLAGYGHRADDSPWRVGLANPRQPDQPNILSVLPVQGQAVATSGDYMNSFTNDLRLHHIIDPRTGVSPAGLASVTVVAPSATQADALSTALLVMGRAPGLALIDRLPGVEALIITKEMQVHHTPGFPARL